MKIKKLLQYKGKMVLVASPPSDPQGGCPRLIVNKSNALLRDDYHSSVKIKGNLIKSIF
ncbi:MAG: hypothetical protein M1360_01515 [Candidatus Marsarchaeota archaeon]|jgi:hypothetical protein|nr:hypothetical protein [Candidatus Marsarchaeota archaeon]MCL5418600.1 hypothetical protein [Candidatus Marsarchaeota archaeon]